MEYGIFIRLGTETILIYTEKTLASAARSVETLKAAGHSVSVLQRPCR